MPSFINYNPSEQVNKLKLVWRRIGLPVSGLIIFLIILTIAANRLDDQGNRRWRSWLKGGAGMAISPLDGRRYSQSAASRPALGVVIENHPESRPQSGLGSASLVYEAKAEGGITRFLAIFGPVLPAKVGPVRSARTYFLDWCLEYNCYFAHVGGNIDALDLIPKLEIKDLDQFRYGTGKYGRTYYRMPKKGIATEHTMYADPIKLYEIAGRNGWPTTIEDRTAVKAAPIELNQRPESQSVTIEISSRQYNTKWDYDRINNIYVRSMADAPHTDAETGQAIRSSVLVIQEIASQSILTRINEQGLKMATLGQGKAVIFQNGRRIDGQWQKDTSQSPTRFTDDKGRTIGFIPGNRWYTIVEPGSRITVTP